MWWLYAGRRAMTLEGPAKEILVGKEVPRGITFLDGAIIININGQLKAFEAKCTHLGCRITKAEGETIICPCHGSKFDLSGKPLGGPARQALAGLKLQKDNAGNYFIVRP